MVDILKQILNMSLTASIIILFVMAARLLLKKAPKIYSYALWAVVLFRLLCPVSLTAPVSVLEVTKPQVMESAGITSTVTYVPYAVPETDAPIQEEPTFAGEHREPQRETTPDFMDIAPGIWLAGIAVMVLYSAVIYLRLRRNLIGAMPYKGNTYLADHIDSPFVLGILRPRIYLPSAMPIRERRYIIAHERHHIRRGDHILKLLAYAALCIHWFNPLVWAAFLLAGKDMEMSCDEAVIKKLGEHIRADYSASLLRFATGRRLIAGTPLAFGEGDTKGRVLNMAKWKKPKVWVSVLCVVTCVVILIVCAVNPEKGGEEAATAEIFTDPLEKCEQVLQNVQSSGGYHIITNRQNIGGRALNKTSVMANWKHGDNRLYINIIPEDDFDSVFAYLYRDGVFYENESTSGVDENGNILWNESSYQRRLPDPWLAVFQWDADKIELLSTEDTDTYNIIHLAVNDHLENDNGVTERYTVDFSFDKEGNFVNATLTADFYDEKESYSGIINTMRIVSLDADAVAAEIEAYFKGEREATEIVMQNGSTSAGFGELYFTLPAGYTMEAVEADMGDYEYMMQISDGTNIIGGVVYYEAPDFARISIEDTKDMTLWNDREWIAALGLPDAMDETLGYMGGNSLYADYEIEYFTDLPEPIENPVQRQHYFFLWEDAVYDFWFDKTVTNYKTIETIMQTAAVGQGGPLIVETTPAETEALEKCRAVLEMVQSGSCQIAIEQVNGSSKTLWSVSNFYQHDGNWMKIIDIDPETVDLTDEGEWSARLAYMYVDGVRYSNEGRGGNAYSDINWAEYEYFDDTMKSWLASFQWDEDRLTYMDTFTNSEGTVIKLRIDEPYPGLEEETKSYLVDFWFDPSGSFAEVKLVAYYTRNNEPESIDNTESIVTLDAATVAAEISKEYFRATGESLPLGTGNTVVTDLELYQKTFTSDDGTVTINFDTAFVPEQLEVEKGLSMDELLTIAEDEFRATSVDDYGLDTTAMGYVGATCELNITEIRAGNSYLISATEAVPTIEIWGERIYTFANGDRLGQENGDIKLLLINPQDGTILVAFGRKD